MHKGGLVQWTPLVLASAIQIGGGPEWRGKQLAHSGHLCLKKYSHGGAVIYGSFIDCAYWSFHGKILMSITNSLKLTQRDEKASGLELLMPWIYSLFYFGMVDIFF